MFYKYHYVNTYNFLHLNCDFYGCENDNVQMKKCNMCLPFAREQRLWVLVYM